MKRMHVLMLVCGAFNASQIFAQSKLINKYKTGLTPYSYGHCDTVNDKVKVAFESAAKINAISSVCSDLDQGTEIVISYGTPDGHDLKYSSTREFGGIGRGDVFGRGYIRTEEDCEKRKSVLTAQFRSATKLDPFFVRCSRDQGASNSDHPWFVAIDAIGTEDMHFQYLDRHFGDGLTTSVFDSLSEIRNYYLNRPDVLFVDGVYRFATLGLGRLSIALYSKATLSLKRIEGRAVKLSKDCPFESSELKRAVGQSGIQVLTSACLKQSNGRPIPAIAVEGEDRILFQSTGLLFSSMEQCRAERATTISNLQASLGAKVLGSMCTDEDSKVEAIVIETR